MGFLFHPPVVTLTQTDPDQGAAQTHPGMTDLVIITDPRFMGGTAAAVVTDIRALAAHGLRVGLCLHRSEGFFQPGDGVNPALEALCDLDGVTRVSAGAPIRAQAALFHNPQVFQSATGHAPRIAAERAFVIAHHPPILGNGALCYDPLQVTRAIRRDFGLRPDWVPISGLLRAQLESFAPLIRITPEDWPNSFDTEVWRPTRPRLMGPVLTIGRHGRAHPDKWPARGRDIAASLPADAQTRVRVLGADPAFFARHGVDTSAWDILPFNAEPVRDFLDSLDVFSYFHAPIWREAFGRTVAEAMLMETRCILDESLRPTFGPHALYGRPDEVSALIAHIRAHPDQHRTAAKDAGDWCRQSFSAQDIAARYQRLLATPATRGRPAQGEMPPHILARKWLGFHRRRRASSAATVPQTGADK